MKRILPILLGSLGLMCAAPAQTVYYWDVNGDTNGFGTSPRDGTWGLDTFWTTSASGNIATVAWPNNVRPATPDVARFEGGNGTITVTNSQTVAALRVAVGGSYVLTNGTIRIETGNFGNGVQIAAFDGDNNNHLTIHSALVLGADGGSGTREMFLLAGRTGGAAATNSLTINGSVTGDISGRAQRLLVQPVRSSTSGVTTITFGSNSVISDGTSTSLNMEYGTRTADANSGRVVINATNNTYTGGTRIGSGTIVVNANAPSGSAGAFGNSTSALDIGFGQLLSSSTSRLLMGAGGITNARNIEINKGTGSVTDYGVVLGGEHTSGTSTFSGGINLAAPTTGANARTTVVQLTAAAGGTVNFSGVLSHTAAGSSVPIEKIGAGTVVFSTNNTYTGGTTITEGTLQLGNGGTAGSVVGNITNNAALVINRQSFTLSNIISGTGSLTHVLAGNTMIITGNNSFSGPVNVNAGTIEAQHANALGNASVSNVVNVATPTSGAALRLSGGITIGQAINIDGTVGSYSSALTSASGSNTVTGLITLKNTSGGSRDIPFNLNGGTVLSINGGITADAGNTTNARVVLSGSGAANVNSAINNNGSKVVAVQVTGGDNTVNWNTAGNFSGGLSIGRGTVNVGVNNPFSGASTIFLSDGSATGATAINLLTTGAYSVTNNISVNNNNVGGLTTVGGSHTSGTSTYSGNILFLAARELRLTAASGGTVDVSGVVSGTGGSINKVGAGTVNMTRSNTFTGATVVSSGTLRLNSTTGGALASTASVTVSNTATLLVSSSGQVNDAAAVTLSGGTIAKGGGVINETFGALALSATSFVDFGAGTGNFTFASYAPGAFKLTFQNFNVGNSLTVTNGTFAASEFEFGSFDYSWSATPSGGFTITAIPEPSTVAAALGLLGLLGWPAVRRFRAKRS